MANPFYGVVAPTAGALATSPTVTAGQLLRPYPQFKSGITNNGLYEGNSTYQALLVKVQKRFVSGGLVSLNYSWSKMLDDASGAVQDWNNLSGNRAVDANDVPNRMIVNWVYPLPLGKGGLLFNKVNTWANRLISGWGLDGIATFQRGFPLAITASGSQLTQFGAGTPRPNLVPGCNIKVSGRAENRLKNWFNTACFTSQPAYGYGTTPAVLARVTAEGIENWDLALAKKTDIAEGAKFEFRFEAFNLTNRPQFNAPNTVCCSATSFGIVAGSIGAQNNGPRTMQVVGRITF